MPADDPDREPEAPDGTDEAEPDTGADEADVAHQAAVDADLQPLRWIRAALSVLTAEIDAGDFDPMSRDAVREMRVEAARRASRIFRADIEPPD